MGRALRTNVGDIVYHCLNRVNACALIFDGDGPWTEKIVSKFGLQTTMRSRGRQRTQIKGF